MKTMLWYVIDKAFIKTPHHVQGKKTRVIAILDLPLCQQFNFMLVFW